jgi:cytochrome c
MNLHIGIAAAALAASLAPHASAQSGAAARGERVFRACAACHSLLSDRNLTGPSLAELWHRRAGGLASFRRYSPALRDSGVVWDDTTLDAWLKDPAQFIPGNAMMFPAIKDAQQRADLIAYLKEATQKGAAPSQREAQRREGMGGMMGMMGGEDVPNLRKPAPGAQVTSISYCPDTYTVTTADGTTRQFWERNLRFKTDSSEDGPVKGAPAMVGAGMMGDRASLIFAGPEEISGFIVRAC